MLDLFRSFSRGGCEGRTGGAAVVTLLAFLDLLRGHVDGRADVGHEVVAAHELGEAKVADLDVGRVVLVEQRVVELEVAVRHVLAVAVVHRLDALLQAHHAGSARVRARCSGGRPLPRGGWGSVQCVGREERHVAGRPCLRNGDGWGGASAAWHDLPASGTRLRCWVEVLC